MLVSPEHRLQVVTPISSSIQRKKELALSKSYLSTHASCFLNHEKVASGSVCWIYLVLVNTIQACNFFLLKAPLTPYCPCGDFWCRTSLNTHNLKPPFHKASLI